MSKYQISFKILEYKPIIPDINNYYYEIICYETKFKDYIYCFKNNTIIDSTNLKKNLKYIIKLMKKGKILAVGNLTLNKEILTKKIKQKRNINLFITENNYRKIFSKNDLSKINKYENNIALLIEINIKYNNIKLKEINAKKLKLIRRNFSYQDRDKNNDYFKKSINNLTTSTTNINTFNNVNNIYDNDYSKTENNINYISSEKYIITTPPCIITPKSICSPLSDTNIRNKRKRKIESGLISNVSFKNNTLEFKNKLSDNIKYNNNIFDLKSRIKQRSSRNNTNKFLYNKKKINILITQESSSSKKTNTITQSSIINSALIDKYDNIIESKVLRNNNNETIQNIINNKNTYNKDNDSFELYMKEIEFRKNIILNEQDKRNIKLLIQEEKYNKLFSTLNDYESKIKITKIEINKIKEKNELLKYKEEIIIDTNKELIPIISKIKESKQIENNIINSIMKNYKDNNKNKNKNKTIENNIEKYDKNLMIKMLKNLIQGNNNIDIYLKDEHKQKLKLICDKYNIFGSIIEDIEE